MQTITVSATKARNDFFNILSAISKGKSFIVKKDNENIAMMTPIKRATDLTGLSRVMNEIAESGVFADFDLSKSPLRNKKAKAWLKRIRSY